MNAQDQAFLNWFQQNGGSFSSAIQISHTAEFGRQVQATREIAEDEELFQIPRHLVLSVNTSPLPQSVGQVDWSKLANSWAGLILCVMHEMLQSSSHWAPYLAAMPTQFNTLMFWDHDLSELEGSLVLKKIGKQEAEQEFHDLVVPLLQSRPDIFAEPTLYSLDLYHRAGSTILSRSFNVQDTNDSDSDSSEEDEEAEDITSVALVPFADILNARSGQDNARLFYDDQAKLVMRSTAVIPAGAQIWNTYADPPNSDLLRRYGHVDEPNANDVVEIEADLIASVVCKAVVGVADLQQAKIDWMLDHGMDDVISLSQAELLPDELISTILLFAASAKAFDKIRTRGEAPLPQTDGPVCKLLRKTLQARLGQYPTTIVDDEKILATATGRLRQAVVVRLGEKRLLQLAIEHVTSLQSDCKTAQEIRVTFARTLGMSAYKSAFTLLDVEHSNAPSDDDEEIQTGHLTPASSQPATPLSKKARARRRAAERKALQANYPIPPLPLSHSKLNGAVTDPIEELVQDVQEPPQVDEPKTLDEPIELAQINGVDSTAEEQEMEEDSSSEDGLDSSSEDEEPAAAISEPEDHLVATQDQVTPPASPLSFRTQLDHVKDLIQSPSSPTLSSSGHRRSRSRVMESVEAPLSKDHVAGNKTKAIITRTVWTFMMLFGFMTLLMLGHAPVILLVFFVEAQVFRELTGLFETGSKAPLTISSTPISAWAFAKIQKRAQRARYSKVLSWYFFATTNYYLYGETIIYYFKHIVLVDAYFIPFAKHHRFISLSLYLLGFVGFVTTLKKETARRQFGLFCWIHISLFLIVVSSHFIVDSILEGLIWFWVPASLVICNDIWAYICGMTFGRTPLIQLSPKKTVEGFIGALFMTIVFGYFWGTLFMRWPYFVCPCKELGTTAFNAKPCELNPVFLWHDFVLPQTLSDIIHGLTSYTITTIPYALFQFHTMALAVFASLVAPFGGFFASGFKRAFNIKDFGDSIPGHGGMTDRMDCQFLMGAFSYFYYTSLIRVDVVTVATLLQSAVGSLTRQDQILLIQQLTKYIERTSRS